MAQYTFKDYYDKFFEKLDPIEGVYSVKETFSNKDYWQDGYTYVGAILPLGNGWFTLTSISSVNTVINDWDGTDPHSFFEDFDVADYSKYNGDHFIYIYRRIGNTDKYEYQRWRNGKIVYSTTFSLQSLFEFEHSLILPWDEAKEFVDLNVLKRMRIKPQIQIRETMNFSRIYPTNSMYESYVRRIVEEETKPKTWSGTGFTLGNGYLVTNYHVVEEAGSISVKGVGGNSYTSYSASVVTADMANDIAILRITDSRFTGFGAIPYNVTTRMAEVGEDVFVLGYPLTQTMGNEIKLTNGIISSRTGYQGDAALYQMTAPIQPGNSGGPMFDSKGNVVGIVVAHHAGAENAGYAIKTSYLKNLIESAGLSILLPSGKNLSNLSLSEMVKRVKPFVCLIECGR